MDNYQAAIGGSLSEVIGLEVSSAADLDDVGHPSSRREKKPRPDPLVELPLSGDPPPTPDRPMVPTEPVSMDTRPEEANRAPPQ